MKPILTLENLDMRFGGVQALSNVGFEAGMGAITAVIGPNGAGKTTAINCLTGVYTPQNGKAVFKEQSIFGQKPHHLAALGLARTFQNLQMFNHMTVLENVMLGLHAATKKEFISSLFRLPGLLSEEARIKDQAFAMLEAMKMSHLALNRAGQLSYGDQKRVEIARALVARPALVFLDEPAAGLNMTETRDMAGFILSMKEQGVSVILVEHDMDLVMGISDQVVVLNHGRKIAQGSPLQVQNNQEVIAAYLGVTDEL
ncbi:ABC transporter ATP-binding protein [Dethiosulfatarculus sandiegensis]|uniref:ABC transporter domain-containing protein n=1 Tax=Dethiosulfatarculus sandiegensis TaxID=1429043 RepID=A0A0D2GBT9_9BACT|nr:ABC transporter ATP-binding protein [Dethiosulfatarculus sandiegensis]KIX12362.1 hypothetical protein X474_19370 [Dethiosulfatarculus sandiegensis]